MHSSRPIQTFEDEQSDRSAVQLVLGSVERIPVARVRWLVELAERMGAPEHVHAHLRTVLADAAYGEPGVGALLSQVDRELESRFWRSVSGERSLNPFATGPRAAARETRGTLELVTCSAKTVREALLAMGAVADIAYGVPVFSIAQRADGSVGVIYESPKAEDDAAARLAAEVALASVVELVRRAVGDVLVGPRGARVRGVATGRGMSFARAIGCEVRLGAASDRVDFAADVVAMPLIAGDPAVHEAGLRLARLEREELFRGQAIPNVRRALRDLVGARGGSNDELMSIATAALLRTRPRTMQAQLTAEGTSFRTLVDEARRVAADRMLAEGRALSQIQATLGYGDSASLRRACRRWWGVGPMARRNALA